MLPSALELRPFNLRTASEQEYRALNAFENCIQAERLPDDPPVPLPEAIQRWQNIPTYVEVLLWVAWDPAASAIVARGEVELWRTETNQHVAYFDIAVLPAFRRQGLARQLLALIVATAQAEQRRLLMAHTNERVPAGAAFMQWLAARPGLVGHTNQLVLAELDPELLRCWQTPAKERTTAFELSCWIGAWPEEQIAEFAQLITAGVNQQPLGELQLEEFNFTPARIRQQEQLWAATGTERWTMIAHEQATGRAVGLTEVWWQPNRPTILQQGLTVVLPAYRNRGLGRWLKAAMLAKVVQDRPQVQVVRTGNADSNAAMLKINHALGFKPYLAGCFWQVETAQVLAYLQLNMTHLFTLPQQPAIAGLTFRHLAADEDAAALEAVHLARRDPDQVDLRSTFEDYPDQAWLQMLIDQARAEKQQENWLIAQVGSQVVSYSQIIWWLEGDGTWVYLIKGWVVPTWRGQGIGTAMLTWGEARARQLAVAQHPGAPIEFAANASSTEREATALLQAAGYRAGYTMAELGLTADSAIPSHPLPPGITVRPAQPDHYPLLAASVIEAYQVEKEGGRFDEVGAPDEFLHSLRDPKHDPTLWQVAWAGDEVVGQVLAVIEHGRAEVFEVSVRPAWRRRGLARALLSRAVQTLRTRGIAVIRLHTNLDFKTRAVDLYQSVGFRVLKEFPRYRKPLDQTIQVQD